MALAGPGIIAIAHPMIAAMRSNRAGDRPAIQRFQQVMKCATTVRHGRPQNHVWRHDFDPKYRDCLPYIPFPRKKSRTAMGEGRDPFPPSPPAFAGVTGYLGPILVCHPVSRVKGSSG